MLLLLARVSTTTRVRGPVSDAIAATARAPRHRREARANTHAISRADGDGECAAEYKRRIACDPERLSNLSFAFAIVLAGVRESKQAMQKTRFDEDAKIDASTGNSSRACSTTTPSWTARTSSGSRRCCEPRRRGSSECSVADERGRRASGSRKRASGRCGSGLGPCCDLFDCVQCGACRIHGKVAWFGVATALKLIYSKTNAQATHRRRRWLRC